MDPNTHSIEPSSRQAILHAPNLAREPDPASAPTRDGVEEEEEDDEPGALQALMRTLGPNDRIEVGDTLKGGCVVDGIVRVLLIRPGQPVEVGLGWTIAEGAASLLDREPWPADWPARTCAEPTRAQLLAAADELENSGNLRSDAGRAYYAVADWLRARATTSGGAR